MPFVIEYCFNSYNLSYESFTLRRNADKETFPPHKTAEACSAEFNSDYLNVGTLVKTCSLIYLYFFSLKYETAKRENIQQ